MIKFKALILILALFTIQQLSFAQNFTVTIKTDYCSVPGSVKLTANPDPASNDYFFTWNTIPIENTKDIVVNVAGQYTVTVKNGGGDEVTQTLNISSNLVVNGDFELGNVGFTSTYIYTNPGPDSLWQENRYTVDENPSFSHINFWGKDHTTNSGKFMIINGVGSSSVWSQKIDNLLSNTDYYFSAYAISLNSVNPFANLQFSVNGIQIGTVTGPLPSRPNNNNPPYDWTQFYGIWNSGSSNSVVLSIADLESALDGNDFGLDDISFGTITPLPLAINVNANKPCEGDALQLTTTIDGGKYPYSFSWTGPAGFTSELPNPVIPNVSMANAGSYTVNVTDGNSCSPPVSKDITVIVNPAITGGSITGGSTTCAGSTSDLLTLAGNSGSVVNWQRSVAPFTTWTDIPNTEATFTSGILPQTTHFRAVVQNESCIGYSDAAIVIIDNTPPTITTIAENRTVECDGNGNSTELNAWLASNGGAIASDNISGISWTNNFTTLNSLCGASGSADVTFTAKDNCGNISSTIATFTIVDITAPILSSVPANVTVDCSAVPLAATLTASDNCDATPIVTFNEVRTEGACPNSYILTRTWTAKDACSNTSSVSQTITVQDVTAPVLSDAPANVTVQCNAVPLAATLTASDNCDGTPIVTFNEVRTDGTCPNSYILTRTWTAKDACSNTSSVSQIITVQDLTAPTLSCPENITVNNDPGICGATITVPKPSVTENCGTALLINNFNQTSDASGLYPGGVTTVLWTVTDDCGNASTCEMTVTVNDTEKPAITCPSSITLCSGEQPVLGTATATDNCDKAPIISNNAPSIFVDGTTTVIWTATDLHGNTSTCTQLVTISPKVTASAGSAATLCSTIPYQLSGATAANFASVAWSHNGHGSLSNSIILNPTYTPSAGETGSIEFTLTAKGLSECGNTEASDKFVLTIYPALNVNAGLDTIIGSGTSITLHSQVSGGSGVYVYKWSPAEFLVDNTKIKPVTVPLTNVTVFTLNILDELSRCNASDDVKISINDVIRPIARDDYARTDFTHSINVNVQANDSDPIGLGLTISISVDPKKGSAIVNEDGTITYTNLPNYTGKEIQDTLTYIICDKGTPSKCASARLIITISQERQEFEIFNLLTPNGDGKNDYWQINGIELYPNNEITLFNRWGDKINQYTGYNNTDKRWNGTNENKEFLPDGVYFYIIKLNDQNANPNTFKGWVYVRGKGGN